MYDQHVHSSYSPDSKESMENYIINTDQKVITFTEHYEYQDPYHQYQVQSFDFKKQRNEMNQLELLYDVTILQGIEIGYSKHYINEIKTLLKENKFDCVLLSVHHNNIDDYQMEIPRMNDFDIIKEYFDIVEEALSHQIDADVVTHIDYGLRVRNITLDDLKRFEPKLIQIFSLIIENKMSLEINAKSLYIYQKESLYHYLIDLYLSLGGTDFVVNSDAHLQKHHYYRFEDIYQLLKQKGIDTLNYYVNREKIQYRIPTNQEPLYKEEPYQNKKKSIIVAGK